MGDEARGIYKKFTVMRTDAEHPILFSAPMVLAILAGKKTQTRRLVKIDDPYNGASWIEDGGLWRPYSDELCRGVRDQIGPGIRCPYGQPGDCLWVRETFRYGLWIDEHFYNDIDGESRSTTHWVRGEAGDEGAIWYEADGKAPADQPNPERWDGKTPSIFMPRWASRITLEVTDVRIERLCEISSADIRAEGIDEETVAAMLGKASIADTSLSDLWRLCWDRINGKRAPWSSNPWVWRVSFRRVKP